MHVQPQVAHLSHVGLQNSNRLLDGRGDLGIDCVKEIISWNAEAEIAGRASSKLCALDPSNVGRMGISDDVEDSGSIRDRGGQRSDMVEGGGEGNHPGSAYPAESWFQTDDPTGRGRFAD